VKATCPQLYHNGRQLLTPTALLYSIGVQPGDVIELYSPDDSELDDNFWVPAAEGKGERIVEGPAFGGTLLGSSGSASKNFQVKESDNNGNDGKANVINNEKAPPIPADGDDAATDVDQSSGRACKTCTFLNPAEVSCCTMCDSPF